MNDKFRFGELKACIILGVLPLKCIIYGVLYIKETSFVYHDKRGFFIAFFISVWYTYLDKSGLKKV